LTFLAEALQHTVFPGIVIAFLTGQSLLLGATAAAILTVVMFSLASSKTNADTDSVLAVLVTLFFGLGVVLVSRSGSFQHDLTTLVFGRLLSVSTAELVQTGVVAVVVVAVLIALHKELMLRAFDESGAKSMGYSVVTLDLVLNCLVAAVVVASVRSVGTVLMVAFIVTPALTGRMAARRVGYMLAVGLGCSLVAGWVGLGLSYELSVHRGVNLAAGATVVLLMTVMFLLVAGYQAIRRSYAPEAHNLYAPEAQDSYAPEAR